MKAVILAAGPTLEKYLFPPNSKPKCLFTYKGEVLLEKNVRVLKECGINDIRVVIGYRKELIEKFVEAKNLDVDLAYNPTAASDKLTGVGWDKGLDSVRVGLQGVEDDVLIIFGDTRLTTRAIRRVLDSKHPCISLYSGHGYQLWKIPEELLPSLRELHQSGAMMALHKFCIANNGVKIWDKERDAIEDIDWWDQTDEFAKIYGHYFKRLGDKL